MSTTNYKAIKHVPNLSGYEMSEDGMHVRSIEKKQECKLDLEACKVTLVTDEGKEKAFGLRTLYHRSWNKHPSMYPESEKAKTMKTGERISTKPEKAPKKEKPQKVKKMKAASVLFAKKGQLISQIALHEMQMHIKNRLSMEQSCNGLFVYDGKSTELRLVVYNKDKAYGVVNVDAKAPTKAGMWFMNMETGHHVRFDATKDKPGRGDSAIVWPEEL